MEFMASASTSISPHAQRFLIILEREAAESSRRGCGLAGMWRTQSSDLAGGYVGCGGRALGRDRPRRVRQHDGPLCSAAAGAMARQCQASVRLGEGLSGVTFAGRESAKPPNGGRFDSLPMRTSDRLRLSSRMMPADGPGPVAGSVPPRTDPAHRCPWECPTSP